MLWCEAVHEWRVNCILGNQIPDLWPYFQFVKIDETPLPVMADSGIPELRVYVDRLCRNEALYCTKERQIASYPGSLSNDLTPGTTIDPFEPDAADLQQAVDRDHRAAPYIDKRQRRSWKAECAAHGWPNYCATECARLPYPKALAACPRLNCECAHAGEITAEFPNGIPAHAVEVKELAKVSFAKLAHKNAPTSKRPAARNGRGRGRKRFGRGKGRAGKKSKGGPIRSIT